MFVYKPRWFTLSQTEGEEMPEPVSRFDVERALASWGRRLPFEMPTVTPGYAPRGRSPSRPSRSFRQDFFHETAHLCCLRIIGVVRQSPVQ